MNETPQPEDQLLNWTPRQPSANLKVRLFEKDEVLPRSGAGRWFAPVTAYACVILVVLSLGFGWVRQSTFSGRNLVPKTNFAMNRIDANIQWNIWMKATFEWTNREVLPSSMGSLQLATTNLLMR